MQFAMTGVVIPEGSNTVNTTHSSVQITTSLHQYGEKITSEELNQRKWVFPIDIHLFRWNHLEGFGYEIRQRRKVTFVPLLRGRNKVDTLSVLVNSAAVVTSLPITVFDPAVKTRLSSVDPLKEVVEGETTEIEFTY